MGSNVFLRVRGGATRIGHSDREEINAARGGKRDIAVSNYRRSIVRTRVNRTCECGLTKIGKCQRALFALGGRTEIYFHRGSGLKIRNAHDDAGAIQSQSLVHIHTNATRR